MECHSVNGNPLPASALPRHDRSTGSLRLLYLFLLGLALALPEPWESASELGYYSVADKGLYTADSLPPVDRSEQDLDYPAVAATFTLHVPESRVGALQPDPQYAHSHIQHSGNGIRAPPTFSS